MLEEKDKLNVLKKRKDKDNFLDGLKSFYHFSRKMRTETLFLTQDSVFVSQERNKFTQKTRINEKREARNENSDVKNPYS